MLNFEGVEGKIQRRLLSWDGVSGSAISSGAKVFLKFIFYKLY